MVWHIESSRRLGFNVTMQIRFQLISLVFSDTLCVYVLSYRKKSREWVKMTSGLCSPAMKYPLHGADHRPKADDLTVNNLKLKGIDNGTLYRQVAGAALSDA
jgi:hypothetical protein